METEKELKKKLEEANETLNKKLDSLSSEAYSLNFDEFQKLISKERQATIKLDKKYRQIKSFTLRPFPGYGDFMTLKEFVENVKDGGFIDYDGFGVYCTKTEQADIHIYPSDVKADRLRKDFTHVLWFNR